MSNTYCVTLITLAEYMACCYHYRYFQYLTVLLPKSAKLLKKVFGYSLLNKAAMEFFVDVTKQTLDSRKQGDKVNMSIT